MAKGEVHQPLGDPPPKRAAQFAVAVPASLVADVPHLREKTAKIGLVGRALSIFRVESVIVYPDLLGVGQKQDLDLMSSVLSYMEMPPHIRRRMIRLSPRLRFVGILPPLQTPHHPSKKHVGEVEAGELREGAVDRVEGQKSYVDVGLERDVEVQTKLPLGKRVTLRITETKGRLRAEFLPQDRIDIYWGYRVTVSNLSVGRILKSGKFDLTIATSRYGREIQEVLVELRDALAKARRTLIAFGSPKRGLREILAQEGMRAEDEFDFFLNTVPSQGVETVRTEEAIYATLAVLNTLS